MGIVITAILEKLRETMVASHGIIPILGGEDHPQSW